MPKKACKAFGDGHWCSHCDMKEKGKVTNKKGRCHRGVGVPDCACGWCSRAATEQPASIARRESGRKRNTRHKAAGFLPDHLPCQTKVGYDRKKRDAQSKREKYAKSSKKASKSATTQAKMAAWKPVGTPGSAGAVATAHTTPAGTYFNRVLGGSCYFGCRIPIHLRWRLDVD
jgi:hypothetical protein